MIFNCDCSDPDVALGNEEESDHIARAKAEMEKRK